jgi:hypothetical protein
MNGVVEVMLIMIISDADHCAARSMRALQRIAPCGDQNHVASTQLQSSRAPQVHKP